MTTSDPRTSLTRSQNRGSTDRARVDELLDTVHTGVLSTVVDDHPWSMPIFFARDGDRLLFHGSTGAGALRHIAQGAPVTFTVFALDGLVVAYSAFESSANYRSVVVRGIAKPIDHAEANEVLDKIVDRLLPGRRSEVPPNSRREIAATLCLELPLVDGQWIFKFRAEDSTPPEDDTDVPYWTGVVPVRQVLGEPVRDAWNSSGATAPASVIALYEQEPRE